MSEWEYSINFNAHVKWGQLWLSLSKAYATNAAPSCRASTAYETNKQWHLVGRWYLRYSTYNYAKAHAQAYAAADAGEGREG